MERRWTRRSLMAAPLATSPFIRQRRALADQSLRFAPGSTIGKTSEGWTDLGEVSTVAAGTTAVARKITLLEPFAGRVYLGYGDFQATSQPGTDVICVDGDDYRTVLPGVKTDALYDARRVADRLWYCVTDPEVGTDPDLVIVDEHHQANVESTPHVVPWHVFDAASFNGYAFLAGARRETDPFNCCCIWRRDSDGQWTAIDGTEGYSTDHRTLDSS